jgi:hypothetical protein
MLIIKSKCGAIFSGINESFNTAETKLEIAYYKAQGCIVETVDSFSFSKECNCKHCELIEHEFENLIEEIKEQ